MRHDMESCGQDGEDRDKTWLDGPVARVKGKLEASKRWTVWPDAWTRLDADGPRQR